MLQLLVTWMNLALSLLKTYNKASYLEGVKYLAGTPAYSITMRSALLLASSTRTVSESINANGVGTPVQ